METIILSNEEFFKFVTETKEHLKGMPKRKRRKFAKRVLKEAESSPVYIRENPYENLYDYIANAFEIMGYWAGDQYRILYNIETDEFFLQERTFG